MKHAKNIVYTTKELMELFQVCDETIYSLVRSGRLPARRVGRRLRFTSSDVEKFMEASTVQPICL
jgi:excisionase family DNA binding protein